MNIFLFLNKLYNGIFDIISEWNVIINQYGKT